VKQGRHPRPIRRHRRKFSRRRDEQFVHQKKLRAVTEPRAMSRIIRPEIFLQRFAHVRRARLAVDACHRTVVFASSGA
jgi:hypothetical protein